MPLWIMPLLGPILFQTDLSFFGHVEKSIDEGELFIYSAALLGPLIFIITRRYGELSKSTDKFRDKNNALYRRIKRLGFATEGRVFEPITQATFVESLMPYLSSDPKKDRDILLRGGILQKAYGDELYKMPFRNLFVDKQDLAITEIMSNYFNAVRNKWPLAWEERGKGMMLNRTNGFRALMRFLRHRRQRGGER
jgi:hypothetical protein